MADVAGMNGDNMDIGADEDNADIELRLDTYDHSRHDEPYTLSVGKLARADEILPQRSGSVP